MVLIVQYYCGLLTATPLPLLLITAITSIFCWRTTDSPSGRVAPAHLTNIPNNNPSNSLFRSQLHSYSICCIGRQTPDRTGRRSWWCWTWAAEYTPHNTTFLHLIAQDELLALLCPLHPLSLALLYRSLWSSGMPIIQGGANLNVNGSPCRFRPLESSAPVSLKPAHAATQGCSVSS